jgi:hypothetical protein
MQLFSNCRAAALFLCDQAFFWDGYVMYGQAEKNL